ASICASVESNEMEAISPAGLSAAVLIARPVARRVSAVADASALRWSISRAMNSEESFCTPPIKTPSSSPVNIQFRWRRGKWREGYGTGDCRMCDRDVSYWHGREESHQ